MNLLSRARKRAKQLGIEGKLYLSNRKGKKLMLVKDGHKIHFGSDVSHTYLEGASKKKRDAYRARASKITNKKGEYTYLIPYTSNNLAYWLLWT